MRWTPASQLRGLLSPTCADVPTWSLQSMRWATESGKAMRNPGIVVLRSAGGSLGGLVRNLPWKPATWQWCHWGKNSTAWKPPNQPTNHHFSEVWKSSKKARPLQKMYPPFFLVEDGKGEFRLCRFASGIWTSWTGAGNCPISPILPACWLSGSRKTSLLGTCSIWSWQQQNRANMASGV